MCNLIQWSGLWWHPTIGYNAERLHYENHHLTGQSDANEIDCTDSDSLYTNVAYKIRVLDTDISSLQSECKEWFHSDGDYGGNEEVMDFSNTQLACPCTLFEAQQDRRFSLFTAKDNSSCYIQKLPNVRGGAQECCYSTSPQIFGTLVCQGRSSGGLLRFHPWYSPTEYNDDRDAQNTCCFPTISNSHCMLYHMRRPSNCCEGYVPQPRRKFIYKLAFDCNFSDQLEIKFWVKKEYDLTTTTKVRKQGAVF